MESGILAKPGVDSTSTDVDEGEMPVRMMMGMFYEEGMAGMYPTMHWQPGEMERDGVFGTMDGLSEITKDYPIARLRSIDSVYAVLVEEFKLTWKSEFNYGKEKITSNWMWMRQVMGYLAMLQVNGYPDCRWARFHVGWVNGDYRPPQPKLVRYLIEFTQAEIDSNWKMVMRNKDKEGVRHE